MHDKENIDICNYQLLSSPKEQFNTKYERVLLMDLGIPEELGA